MARSVVFGVALAVFTGLTCVPTAWADPPARARGALPSAPLPALPRVSPSLAADLKLGKGREFSVHLTPTPGRCAPLIKLTF